MIPLALLNNGENGLVAKIPKEKPTQDGKVSIAKYIESLGIRVGKKIELLTKSNDGPVLVKVDNTRIALDQKLARRIMLTPA